MASQHQRRRPASSRHLFAVFTTLSLIVLANLGAGASTVKWDHKLSSEERIQRPLIDNTPSQTDMFLPSNVKPTHYDLILEPFPENSTFRGHVDIALDVRNSTDDIVLHIDGLNITASWVTDSSSGKQIPSLKYNRETQTVAFGLQQFLAPLSTASLGIDFVGNIRNDLSGLFTSRFTRPDGSEGDLIMTSMAVTYARRAFPCFDEPALKANFSLAIVADASLTAISNMPVDKIEEVESDGAKKNIVRFQTTPPMSTYLVAYVVGELSYIENTDTRIPIRIYTSPADDVELTRYAAQIVARGLAYYEELFDLEYPLPKLDLMAAPTFLQGGMEYFGIIIAHSTFFPYDTDVDSVDKKELISKLLLHELAHQWFGDTVTLEWWDQTWLNEGGATEVTLYCLQNLQPDWTLVQHRQHVGMSGAMGMDAYRSSHPIEVPVSKPDDIMQVFDQISYSKGALVLKMIREYLSPGVFYSGISRYLKTHAYANAKTVDLWDALSDTSGEDVSALMDPWTKRVGYPFVRVSETEDSIHFEQHRFLLTGDPSPEEDKTIWPVFLNIRTSEGVGNLILKERSGSIGRDKHADDFYLLNANSTNLYRTQYPLARLQKLVQAAKDGQLTAQERSGLVADTCSLAHAGYYKTSLCLDLIKSIDEQNSFPWMEIIDHFNSILQAWRDNTQIHDALLSLYRDLTAPLSHQLGWHFSPSDDDTEQQFRAMLFIEAGMAGDKKVLQAAKEMFDRFMAGDDLAIDQIIRRGVFRMVLLHGGDNEYDAIMRYSQNSRSAYNRRIALQSLLVTENPALVQRTFDAILAREFAPSDASLIFRSVSESRTARDMIWMWARENWSRLKMFFPDVLGIREELATSATRYLTSQKQLSELRQFMKDNDIRGLESEIQLSLEYVRGVVAWVERDTDDLKDFLGLSDGGEL